MSSRASFKLLPGAVVPPVRRVPAAPAAWMPLWMTAGMLALAWTLGLMVMAWFPLPLDWQGVDRPQDWRDLGPWLSAWLTTPRWHPMGWEEPWLHPVPSVVRIWGMTTFLYAPLGMLLHLAISQPQQPRLLGPVLRSVLVAMVLAWLLVCGAFLLHGRPAWFQEILAAGLGALGGALLTPILVRAITLFFSGTDRPARWMLGAVQLPPWTALWLAAGMALGIAALVLPWNDSAFVWHWPGWQLDGDRGMQGWLDPALLVRLVLAVIAYFGLGLFLSIPYLHQSRGQRLLIVGAMLLSVALTLMICRAMAVSAPMTPLQPVAALMAVGTCFARRRISRGQKAVPVVTA